MLLRPGKLLSHSIFYPPQLGNLAAWYRWNQGITVATGVSRWIDQSGNGNDLLQATVGSQPAFQSDGSILFNGTTDFLQASFALASPFSGYLLCKSVSFTATRRLLAGVSAGKFAFRQIGTEPRIDIADSASGSITDITHDTTAAYHVVAGIYNGASSALVVDSSTTTGTLGNISGALGLTMGAEGDGSLPSNIQVKEAALFNAAHNAQQRSVMIRYLGRLGGII